MAEFQTRPSIRAIEAFIAITDEQSISGGARSLGASVSAVSLQLTNLEKSLDCRLIERNAQRFCLTDAGALFRQRALRILDEIDGARTDLTTHTQSPHFTLRMAIVEDFDNHVLPLWLSSLNLIFPNSRFIAKSGPSHENFSSLNSRTTDLIVAVDAMNPVDWIEEHPLMHDPYILITSPQIGPDPSLEELMKYPFMRYAREQHMSRQIEAQLRRIKCTPQRSHEFTTNQALFSMTAAMGGWTISTASAVHGTLSHRDLSRQLLQFHKLPIPAFNRTVSLYTRKDILNTVPQKAAFELRKCLKQVFHPENQSVDIRLYPRIINESDLLKN